VGRTDTGRLLASGGGGGSSSRNCSRLEGVTTAGIIGFSICDDWGRDIKICARTARPAHIEANVQATPCALASLCSFLSLISLYIFIYIYIYISKEIDREISKLMITEHRHLGCLSSEETHTRRAYTYISFYASWLSYLLCTMPVDRCCCIFLLVG
jgi:hypothetical protein